MNVLRARKRSSERIAVALMRSTATARVSGLLYPMRFHGNTVEESPEAEEEHLEEMGRGLVLCSWRGSLTRAIGGVVAACPKDSCRS